MDRSILSPTEISRKLLNKDREDGPQLKAIPLEDDPSLGIKSMSNSPSESAAQQQQGRQQRPDSASASAPDQRYVEALGELHNTLRGRLYDSSGSIVSEVPIRELIQAIQDAPEIDAVVFDGIITQRLIELANKRSVKAVYGIRAGQITRTFEGMLLYTNEQGRL